MRKAEPHRFWTKSSIARKFKILYFGCEPDSTIAYEHVDETSDNFLYSASCFYALGAKFYRKPGVDPGSNVRGTGAISIIFGSQVSQWLRYTVNEMKYISQQCCDKSMDERMALYREQWDNSNMTKVLFGIGDNMLFFFRIVKYHGE